MRGSRFGRRRDSRASRRVALLRIINRLRVELPRDSPLLREQERKLRELDGFNGYEVRRAVS